MMLPAFSSRLVAGLLLLASCSPAAERLSDPREAFHLDLPEGFRLVKRPGAAEDFEVYDVKRGDKALVGIYAGNAPDMVAKERGDRILATGYDWPAWLHIWVRPLPPDERQVAEAIAASVRTR